MRAAAALSAWGLRQSFKRTERQMMISHVACLCTGQPHRRGSEASHLRAMADKCVLAGPDLWARPWSSQAYPPITIRNDVVTLRSVVGADRLHRVTLHHFKHSLPPMRSLLTRHSADDGTTIVSGRRPPKKKFVGRTDAKKV